jgi:hypothetical protein
MYKLFRLSILIATIAIPAIAARDANARRGMRKAVLGMAAYVLAYWLVVALLTPEP